MTDLFGFLKAEWPEVYEAAAIDRVLENLEVLLRIVSARPEARLSELATEMAAAEKRSEEEAKAAGRNLLRTVRRQPAAGKPS